MRSDIEGVKRVCLLIPSLQPGGMERVMAELAGYLASRCDVKVHLILYGRSREVFFFLPKSVTLHVPDFQFSNSLRWWSALRTLWFIRRTVIKISPFSILSFGEYWNSFVLLATMGLKFPVFVSDRCQPDRHLGKTHEFMRRRLYPRATAVIAQTVKAKYIYHRLYPHRNVKVIGNPIRKIRPSSLVNRENIVLTVGRLIDTKHHDRLIRIFAKLNKPGWKLVIVGDDALRQKNKCNLEDLVKSLQIEEVVTFAGRLSDVDNLYLRSKIFAFTSSSEGFPNVIGEAMSAGLPVISYDCIAGPSEMIVNGHNGILIPLFEDCQFEEELRSLMEDQALRERLGANAQKDIAKYDLEIVGKEYFELLLEKIDETTSD